MHPSPNRVPLSTPILPSGNKHLRLALRKEPSFKNLEVTSNSSVLKELPIHHLNCPPTASFQTHAQLHYQVLSILAI